MEILDAHTLSQKLETVFDKLKCAATLNYAFWLCAQDCRRWDVLVILCAQKQHFDGTIKTCGDQKTFGKNQACVE